MKKFEETFDGDFYDFIQCIESMSTSFEDNINELISDAKIAVLFSNVILHLEATE